MDLNNLPQVRIQGTDGKWYNSKPFVSVVKGGKAVIYPTDDGTEIKREPLARYTARIRDEIFNSSNVPESVKARWVIYCVTRTAEELNESVEDTADLLEEHGLIEHILKHYGVLHTQGYEYIAELLIDELRKADGVRV